MVRIIKGPIPLWLYFDYPAYGFGDGISYGEDSGSGEGYGTLKYGESTGQGSGYTYYVYLMLLKENRDVL